MKHDKTATAIANLSIYVALGPSPGQDCGSSHADNAVGRTLIHTVVNLFRITFSVENGMSSTTSVASGRIPVATGAVRDLKFMDDWSLMLAFVTADGKSYLHTYSRSR